jgi:hypothetical protein
MRSQQSRQLQMQVDMDTRTVQVDIATNKLKKEKAPQRNLRGFFLPSK